MNDAHTISETIDAGTIVAITPAQQQLLEVLGEPVRGAFGSGGQAVAHPHGRRGVEPADIPTGLILINFNWVIRSVAVFGIALIGIGLANAFVIAADPAAGATGFWAYFDLDRESNLPSWYSSALLASAAAALIVLTLVCSFGEGRDPLRWRLFAGFVAFLSLDEATSLHEQLILPLRNRLDVHGVLYLSWVIVGAAVVVLAALLMAGAIRRLPRRLRRGLIFASVIYVSGGIGMEAIDGRWLERNGHQNITYDLLTLAEEGLEIAGISLLLVILLREIQRHAGALMLLRASD